MSKASPEICVIAAMSENRVIGKDGKIPWRIPEDLRKFRDLTTPHPVIMGRKTFDSVYEILKRPLPNRVNIVVSRQMPLRGFEGITVAYSIEEALMVGTILDNKQVFIAGGGEIYRQTIDRADRLYLTLVEGSFEGDTYFPDYSAFDKVISEQAGQSGDFKYKFLELERSSGHRHHQTSDFI